MAKRLVLNDGAVTMESVATLFAQADSLSALQTAYSIGLGTNDQAIVNMSHSGYSSRIAEHNLAVRRFGLDYNRPLSDVTGPLHVYDRPLSEVHGLTAR